MKINWSSLPALGLALCLLGACRKDPLNNLTNDESRIYVTSRDTMANFASYKTFIVSDSVAIIQNGQLLGKDNAGYDSAVIRAVRAEMTGRGYVEADSTSAPDLGIHISRVYNTTTAVINYGDYWGDYGGYWDPFTWGYPGYVYYAPYATGIYTLQDGGLTVDLFDLKNASADNHQLLDLWSGLVRGGEVFSQANAASEIDALFSQSAYLKAH